MLSAPEPACLVIADISGYTGYVAGVELDHAQDILADLLGTVVTALRPRFRLAKLEGDAAFAYVPAAGVDAALLQDAIEGTYFAFRRRLRDIRQASRCACRACMMLPRLDLKFVVHHGTVVRQRIAGREELAGRDVILVHRLLKNSVEAALGPGRPYALYTEACLAAGAIDPATHGLVPHVELIDIIGEVRCWLRDLEAAWLATDAAAGVCVTPDEADYVAQLQTRAPREVVWDHLTLPGLQVDWLALDGFTETTQASARRGLGTVNHCLHGKDTIVQEIIGWRPFDFVTTRSAMPMPGVPKCVMTDVLIALPDGGTRVEVRLQAPRPRDRAGFARIRPMLVDMIDAGVAGLAGKLAALDRAESGPPLPASQGRFLSEPVAAGARAN